jgi:hypothetical protein
MSLAFGREGHVVARSGELLKVSLKLTDRGGRVQDVGGNSPNITGCVTVRLITQMASFEMIEDFFWKMPAGTRFARH